MPSLSDELRKKLLEGKIIPTVLKKPEAAENNHSEHAVKVETVEEESSKNASDDMYTTESAEEITGEETAETPLADESTVSENEDTTKSSYSLGDEIPIAMNIIKGDKIQIPVSVVKVVNAAATLDTGVSYQDGIVNFDTTSETFPSHFTLSYFNEDTELVEKQIIPLKELVSVWNARRELMETASEEEARLEESLNNQIGQLHDQLARLLLRKYGMMEIKEYDLLTAMSERQLINNTLIGMFKEMGVSIDFSLLPPSPIQTVFGGKVLSVQSVLNGARTVISNFKHALKKAEEASKEAERLRSEEQALIASATRKEVQASKLLADAQNIAAQNKRDFESFNVPSKEFPFVLRGSYTFTKKHPSKGKEEKKTEVRTYRYLAVKKKHKVDKNQVPLAKYLFLTRNMAQAMRFDSMSEAQKILRGVNVKWASGKLNNKNGFTEKQIRSLTVSRLFVETVNSSGNITKLSNTKKD
jgi:hypothetical protein